MPGAIMNIGILLSRIFNSQITRLAAVLLITSACCLPAFCGSIHDAAKAGDPAKVKALLKENPEKAFWPSNYVFPRM
jgi:hypothetical protein